MHGYVVDVLLKTWAKHAKNAVCATRLCTMLDHRSINAKLHAYNNDDGKDNDNEDNDDNETMTVMRLQRP